MRVGWGGEFRFCCWIQQKHIHINIYVELFDVYYGATLLFNDRWMDGWMDGNAELNERRGVSGRHTLDNSLTCFLVAS